MKFLIIKVTNLMIKELKKLCHSGNGFGQYSANGTIIIQKGTAVKAVPFFVFRCIIIDFEFCVNNKTQTP